MSIVTGVELITLQVESITMVTSKMAGQSAFEIHLNCWQVVCWRGLDWPAQWSESVYFAGWAKIRWRVYGWHVQMLTNAKVNGKRTNATAWVF